MKCIHFVDVMEDKKTVKELSFPFAVRIVKLQQQLVHEKKEFNLSRQVMRSGTSIGANIHEASQGYSRKDFACKMGIALKEAQETEYWLKLLHATEFLKEEMFESLMADCVQLKKMLSAIVKTVKNGRSDLN